jgi:hypothetical protein
MPSLLAREDVQASVRLLVLEMTLAAIAARLPQRDLEEIVSLLVFIAKGSDAARDLTGVPDSSKELIAAGHYAVEFLERISSSRMSDRAPEKRLPDHPGDGSLSG